jgi:hypothetical protein
MGLHFIFLKPNWKQNWPHKKFQNKNHTTLVNTIAQTSCILPTPLLYLVHIDFSS